MFFWFLYRHLHPTTLMFGCGKVKLITHLTMNLKLGFTNPLQQSYFAHWQTAVLNPSPQFSKVEFLYNSGNWVAFVPKQDPEHVNKDPDWKSSVTIRELSSLSWLNVICMLNWSGRENGNEQGGGRDEWKRGLRTGKKREVKLMFGQMEKDGWELMEWVKPAEELGLIRYSSLLRRPPFHTSPCSLLELRLGLELWAEIIFVWVQSRTINLI